MTKLVWHTFAGGTGAPEGKNSYQAVTGGLNGREMYLIDPIADSRGRFVHYEVKYFGPRGYEIMQSKRQIRNAMHAAQFHYDRVIGEPKRNPRRSLLSAHAAITLKKRKYTHWDEYDAAASQLAAKGLTGKLGDPLPMGISVAAVNEINKDPEAFERRVKEFAYGQAMERATKRNPRHSLLSAHAAAIAPKTRKTRKMHKVIRVPGVEAKPRRSESQPRIRLQLRRDNGKWTDAGLFFSETDAKKNAKIIAKFGFSVRAIRV